MNLVVQYKKAVIVLHIKKGDQLVRRGRGHPVTNDKQRVRVLKLTIFRLTLCSIVKFKLLVMQYEHNMKSPTVFYAG